MDHSESTGSIYRSPFFLLAILLTIFLRLPYVGIPFLNLDEAQLMGYGAYIAETGAVYGDGFSDMRGPGAYYFYALLSVFFGPANMLGVHLFAIAFWVLTLVLLVAVSRRVVGDRSAALGGLFYSVFSFAYLAHDMIPLNVSVLTVPLLLAGAWACLKGLEAWEAGESSFGWVFWAGLSTGLIFGIKQVVGIALAVYALSFFWIALRRGVGLLSLVAPYAVLGVGFLVGFAVLFGPSVWAGEGGDALYWGLLYGFDHYGGSGSSRVFFFSSRMILMLSGQPLIWGCLVGWVIAVGWPRTRRSEAGLDAGRMLFFWMVPGQLLGAFVAGHAGGHYFLPVIAFMSPLAAEFVQQLTSNLGSSEGTASGQGIRSRSLRAGLGVLIAAGFLTPLVNYALFPEGVRVPIYSVQELFREKFSTENPYTQAADFIRSQTDPDDRILQLGGYDLYALVERVPAINPATLSLYSNYRKDPRLRAYYEARLDDLRREKPAVIVRPARGLSGINPHGDLHGEIGTLLDQAYEPPIRFEWSERSKFRNGKAWMDSDPGPEWVDVYVLSEGTDFTE